MWAKENAPLDEIETKEKDNCQRKNPKLLFPEAGISKNYSATKSGSPEVELIFCPWIIVQIVNWADWPEVFSMSLLCVCWEGRGLRSASGWIHAHRMTKNSAFFCGNPLPEDEYDKRGDVGVVRMSDRGACFPYFLQEYISVLLWCVQSIQNVQRRSIISLFNTNSLAEAMPFSFSSNCPCWFQCNLNHFDPNIIQTISSICYLYLILT